MKPVTPIELRLTDQQQFSALLAAVTGILGDEVTSAAHKHCTHDPCPIQQLHDAIDVLMGDAEMCESGCGIATKRAAEGVPLCNACWQDMVGSAHTESTATTVRFLVECAVCASPVVQLVCVPPNVSHMFSEALLFCRCAKAAAEAPRTEQ